MLAELTFDAERHEYHVAGERWAGVTEVLDPLQELDGIPPPILRAAAEFGTHVHQACDLFNRDELDWATLDPRLQPYVEAWQNFLLENGAVVLYSEHRVAHRILKYAGTLDAVVVWKGRRCIVDIKTSAEIPRTVGPQVAAYQHALGQLRLPRYCVHLKPDGTYRLKHLTDTNDFNVFVSALNIHNFRRKQ